MAETKPTPSALELARLPLDDESVPFCNSKLPLHAIEAGAEAHDKAHDDCRNYKPCETIDWDSGMIAVAVYRAMTRALLASRPQESSGPTTDPKLLELICLSVARFKAMSPEEQEAHLKAQRESWVRGEMGIGSDKDEAEYIARLSAEGGEREDGLKEAAAFIDFCPLCQTTYRQKDGHDCPRKAKP